MYTCFLCSIYDKYNDIALITKVMSLKGILYKPLNDKPAKTD